MREYIRRRVLEVSRHISETGDTVRETANLYDVSKSTIHKDVTERLAKIDTELLKEVRKVLNYNKAQRHIRGGEATRQKYLEEKEQPRHESDGNEK